MITSTKDQKFFFLLTNLRSRGLCRAPLVRKSGNPSVRENLDLGLYDAAYMYVHPSRYANVKLCDATCIFLAGTSLILAIHIVVN